MQQRNARGPVHTDASLLVQRSEHLAGRFVCRRVEEAERRVFRSRGGAAAVPASCAVTFAR